MTPDLREKARAVKEDWNPKTDDSTVAMLAAFGKEVAEEAIKAERATIVALQRELSDRNDRLSAFTSATPDSPEVKEALEWVNKYPVGRAFHDLPHAQVLARALRAAQVKIGDLETTSAGIFQLEAVNAQARLAEAEKRIAAHENWTDQFIERGKRLESAEEKLAAVKKYLERHDSLYLFEEALAALPPLPADAKGEK